MEFISLISYSVLLMSLIFYIIWFIFVLFCFADSECVEEKVYLFQC